MTKSDIERGSDLYSVPYSIDKDTVRKSISKIKNGKTAELPGVVKVKRTGEAGVEKT